jgi:hypothetical protein
VKLSLVPPPQPAPTTDPLPEVPVRMPSYAELTIRVETQARMLGIHATAAELSRETINEQRREIIKLEGEIAEMNRDYRNEIVELSDGTILSLAEIHDAGRYWDRCAGCRQAECRPSEPCPARSRLIEAGGEA